MSAAVELGNTASYQEKLSKLLDQRNPRQVLSETPGIISAIAAAHPAELLQRRPFEGKWTPCEIIGHLCDAEWVYGYRVRMILSEPEPLITSMDQDLWVNAQCYNQHDPRELAGQFAALRQANLHLWSGMGEAELRRSGRHSERGLESLGLMLRMHAGHDLSHIDQIRRYIAALQ